MIWLKIQPLLDFLIFIYICILIFRAAENILNSEDAVIRHATEKLR